MNNIVTTHALTKRYGHLTAVNELTLNIPAKSVFGLLGPNGSGKTTTLGMLLDVINPTSGYYSWFGNNTAKENRKKIGAILETPAFYPYLSAVDNLRIIAEIKSIDKKQIDDVLKITGLYDRRFSAFGTYSLGMKQRLSLASVLLGDPPVMILDEPTNGLDPQGIAETRGLIRKIAAQGKTIILASHLLDEVQKVCSHFGVLNKGKLVYTGLVNEKGYEEIQLEITTDDPVSLLQLLKSYPHCINIEMINEKVIITLPGQTRVEDVSRFIFENNMIITHLVTLKKSLESQFLEILNQKI